MKPRLEGLTVLEATDKSIFKASESQSISSPAPSPNHHENNFLFYIYHNDLIIITGICIPFLGMEFVQVHKLYPLTDRHTGRRNLLHVERPCQLALEPLL